MEIRINSYIPMTNVEGPNTRFCIWVQGCSIHCKDCANFHMWNKNSGTIYQVSEIIKLIKSYKTKIEGITFLGGEPLDQIEAVTEISKAAQEIGLTVVIFTGYEYKGISDNKNFKKLSKYIDILIDGKYESNKQDFSRPWVGSSNQKYYFFSKKYDKNVIKKYKNKFEIHINKKNNVSFNGMGDFKKLVKTI